MAWTWRQLLLDQRSSQNAHLYESKRTKPCQTFVHTGCKCFKAMCRNFVIPRPRNWAHLAAPFFGPPFYFYSRRPQKWSRFPALILVPRINKKSNANVNGWRALRKLIISQKTQAIVGKSHHNRLASIVYGDCETACCPSCPSSADLSLSIFPHLPASDPLDCRTSCCDQASKKKQHTSLTCNQQVGFLHVLNDNCS